MKTDHDRLLALAGIFQSAKLSDQIARSGMADSEALSASLNSLFQFDAPDVPSIFGGEQNLQTGLRALLQQMTQARNAASAQLTRYSIQLMHLSSKLQKDPARLETIGQHLRAAKQRLEHFPHTHPNIVGQLADIYSEQISTLSPRILVHGEPLHLENPDNVNRIRALLLAGIRAAHLWHQCGGRRRQFLFSRRKIVNQATELVNRLTH